MGGGGGRGVSVLQLFFCIIWRAARDRGTDANSPHFIHRYPCFGGFPVPVDHWGVGAANVKFGELRRRHTEYWILLNTIEYD